MIRVPFLDIPVDETYTNHGSFVIKVLIEVS